MPTLNSKEQGVVETEMIRHAVF